jgi:hypothetical protein
MGISAYVKYKGESVEDAWKREEGGRDEWFGYSAHTMAEIEEFASLAGVEEPLWGCGDLPWIPPQRAAEYAEKLRGFLAEIEPGPPGSVTDEVMCDLAHKAVSFLEVAARHDGYIVD